MSFKKALRSIEASQRRAERESRKRQRELERQQKEQDKMAEVERANYEVQVYENRIEVLTSIHKECGKDWNWEDILLSPAPVKPSKSNTHEVEALDNLNNYQPGLSDKLLRRGDKKRIELKQAVELVIEEDNNLYSNALQKYEQELSDWNLITDLAKRIQSKDVDAYIETIEQIGSFSEITGLGSHIKFNVEECNLVEADLNIHSAEVIPSEVKSLLKSGKLSVKKCRKPLSSDIIRIMCVAALLGLAAKYLLCYRLIS